VNVNEPSKLVDLKASGIVDPTRVTKEALQNAVSIAGTAMTMGALVVDVPKEEKADPAAGMGGMGGMM
jgi:chaperonin GroEL